MTGLHKQFQEILGRSQVNTNNYCYASLTITYIVTHGVESVNPLKNGGSDIYLRARKARRPGVNRSGGRQVNQASPTPCLATQALCCVSGLEILFRLLIKTALAARRAEVVALALIL